MKLTYRHGVTGDMDEECVWLTIGRPGYSDRECAFVLYGTDKTWGVELQIFDDCWWLFAAAPKLWAELASLPAEPQEEDIIGALQRAGATPEFP